MSSGSPRRLSLSEINAAIKVREAEKQRYASWPSLSLHVYANAKGVHCTARVDRLDERGRLVTTDIANATWKPPQVTETLLVEWGQRALAAWLANQLEGSEG